MRDRVSIFPVESISNNLEGLCKLTDCAKVTSALGEYALSGNRLLYAFVATGEL